jgi:membrane protease YdiL (CAAX protease family)
MSAHQSNSISRIHAALWLGACALVYATALALLAQRDDFSLVEPLFVLVVLGGGFSLLAWSVTRTSARTLPPAPATSMRELVVVLGYVALFAVLVLGWGFTAVKAAVTAEPMQGVVLTAVKLATMVGLPLLLLWWLGQRPRQVSSGGFGWRQHGLALVVMALALLAFQAVFGRGLKTLAELGPDAGTLAWAIPACFVWQCIEAGLCEELLFRVFLQQRLAGFFGSNLVAIPVAAILFGLAHAPGLYLRGANAMEGVSEVSLAWAVGYSIAVIAPAGLVFGVLWARTRSLWLVVLLHGLMDTLPGLAGFIREWS